MNLSFERFVLGDFATNSYVVHDGKEALLIDPACPSEELKRWIEERGLSLAYIVNTHGHIDHIGGNAFFKRAFPSAVLAIHDGDLVYLARPDLNLSAEISRPFVSPVPDLVFQGESARFTFGDAVVEVLASPGHTPGSICLFFPQRMWLFSGDTLFFGSVGRTDLPGGSFRDLVASLERIFTRFPDVVTVFPGHGPETTIGLERKNNAYYLMYVAQK
ncbi:MAG: MBL fold metallo-hydrolase [Candidatus Caldatribacterium sp.]|uniref:MBL fold metallo-hydrolase n=1 Tax=Candidatus Caldatribacterium sp. TaxID=2282143 RepID=UPI002995261B|nr:MBL fold metallo-hydrolase [Candidatus Caldatribacterium sp.]MCX7731495.1 MBL fold metallo-hydrolase [Candidatus Caldatribacterium sp.]MDW8081539.1 MBL fold metallo-hydrolase [Candidatus Calescibacterium sp.]